MRGFRRVGAKCVCALMAVQCAGWMAGAAVAQELTPQSFVSLQDKSATDSAAREKFVSHLLAQMTLQEKIEQVSQLSYKDMPRTTVEAHVRAGLGSLLFVTNPQEMNRLQRMAVTESRLHIPMLYGFDVVHGFRTIDPVPLALASSWDPSMVERVQGMAAKEARAGGVHWVFAPMVDIARDPRWGRIMEGAGEDPYLGSVMAAAETRGLQGPYVGSPDHVLACVKHFAAYGAALGGRDYEESDVSEMSLRNVYFPPFHAALHAGAATFMAAYEDLNGVPASGNRWLLHDVLRDQWGFQGFVVSDWMTVSNLVTHGYAANGLQAAADAMNAGVDMEMTSTEYYDHLQQAVQQGMVSVKTLDDAVRPILDMKYRFGLFSDPYLSMAKLKAVTGSTEMHETALLAAERSAVLLKDDGALPLKKSIKTLAVIGPLANSKPDTLGSWSLGANVADTVTVLDGLRQKLGDGVKILSTTGVEIERPGGSMFDPQFASPKPVLTTDAERKAEFARAIAMVKQADVTVLVLGELQDMSGENASRASLTLPGQQEELLEAAVATGKPVVLLLLNGRPLQIDWAATHVPAILEMWYPGTDGGTAAANLLFGDAVPGGKLPVSWPRNVGQVPLYYDHQTTQDPGEAATRYWDMPSTPLYPFGYGLSYTKFSIGNLRLDHTTMASDDTLHVDVDVKNTGAVAGDEVVQLYTHQRAGTASRPVRELKGFERITLQPGETKTVRLTLTANDLAFWSPATKRWQAEPGVFDMWVGDSSAATLHDTFTLGGQDAIPESK
jgi:beta-glucosidase